MIRLDAYRRFVESQVRQRFTRGDLPEDDARWLTEFITVQDGSAAVTTLTVLRDRVTTVHLDLKKLLAAFLTAVATGGATSATTLAAGAVAAVMVLVDSSRRLDPIFGAIVLCMWARGASSSAEILDCVHDRGHNAAAEYVTERLQDLLDLGVLEKRADHTYHLVDRVEVQYRQPPTLAEWMHRHAE